MTIEQHADQVLRLLAANKNVLLLGPPATGKSSIMSMVADKFQGQKRGALRPEDPVPLPREGKKAIEPWMPSPNIQAGRKQFHISFHQNTKHRDFVGGIVPRIEKGTSYGFRVTKGTLQQANEHAIEGKGASLILIDEINRGPAVTIFGDALTAIESDKRLKDDNSIGTTSVPYQAFDEESGDPKQEYLSPHIYIVASMNEADTSVEPLDVAFLRRFKTYRLSPDVELAKTHFSIVRYENLPEQLETKAQLYQVLVQAWERVNYLISIGRGDFYQIGHGILVSGPLPDNMEDAKEFALDKWQRIESHVKEVFFGNDTAQSVVFNADKGDFYRMEEFSFGDQPISKLVHSPYAASDIFALLKQIASPSE